jgi:hypothetical protein
MDINLRARAYGFYPAPSPTAEDEVHLWNSVGNITLDDRDQAVAVKVERIAPPEFFEQDGLTELFQVVQVWIATPLGAGILAKVVEKLLEVVIQWAKAPAKDDESLKKVIVIYGPDDKPLEKIEVSKKGEVKKLPLFG